MMMTLELLLQMLNEAQARVNDKNWPTDVRLRSNETVGLCLTRAKLEGWELESVNGIWMMRA